MTPIFQICTIINEMKVLKILTFFLLVLDVALPGAHPLPGESQTLQRKIKWT